MRKFLCSCLLTGLVFVATPASANFVLGNASKYNLHFSCGALSLDVPAGKGPAVISYNLKQTKYPIAFSYFKPTDKQPVFQGVIYGKVVCHSATKKSCVGSIDLKKKSFADFIEVYKQNKDGDVTVVFDDLPSAGVKS